MIGWVAVWLKGGKVDDECLSMLTGPGGRGLSISQIVLVFTTIPLVD